MVSILRSSLLLVLGAGAPSLSVPVRAAPQAAAVIGLEPDLGAAVLAAHRAYEAAVFARAASDAAGVVVAPRHSIAGADPVRSVLAAERFVALLARRGATASLAPAADAASASGALAHVELGVSLREGIYWLELGDGARGAVLGSGSVSVPFVEKEWVRGPIEGSGRFAHVLRGAGTAPTAEAARSAAREAAAARVAEIVPEAAALGFPVLVSWLEGCELDRFETASAEDGASRCALLFGLDPARVAELRSRAASERRAALVGSVAKGAAGCLWLALCVMLCARADLATRGYLTWAWRSLFTLVFAAGIAALAWWR